MNSIPLLREVTSIFNIQNAPMTDARMTSLVNKIIKYIYILLSIVVVFGGTYYLMNIQRPISGILFFIGSIIAVYFYYVKWFLIPAMRPDWPDYVNMCPDYLTPIAPGYSTDANGIQNIDPNATIKCVDFVGVSQNGYLKVANPADLQNQLNNPQYYFKVDPKISRDDLKSALDIYGLTWLALFRDQAASS